MKNLKGPLHCRHPRTLHKNTGNYTDDARLDKLEAQLRQVRTVQKNVLRLHLMHGNQKIYVKGVGIALHTSMIEFLLIDFHINGFYGATLVKGTQKFPTDCLVGYSFFNKFRLDG